MVQFLVKVTIACCNFIAFASLEIKSVVGRLSVVWTCDMYCNVVQRRTCAAADGRLKFHFVMGRPGSEAFDRSPRSCTRGTRSIIHLGCPAPSRCVNFPRMHMLICGAHLFPLPPPTVSCQTHVASCERAPARKWCRAQVRTRWANV